MQILELAAKLQSVGITDKQAKVYVAALFLGPSPVQKIAQQADVNRATAYVILDELMEMGVVSESTEGKKTVYVAEPPESIERFLEGMQKGIQARKEELKALMPNLRQMERNQEEAAPTIRFYKVDSGFADMNDTLRRKAPRDSMIYGITDREEVLEMIGKDLMKSIPIKRLKKNIHSRLLYYSDTEKLPRVSKEQKREAKLLKNKFPCDMTLYENSALIFSYTSKKSVGIVIEDKDIVAGLRQMFEAYWDSIS